MSGQLANQALINLGNEIKNDPEHLGYSGKYTYEIIDLLTIPRSKTIPEYVYDLKPPQEIAYILIKRGRWEAIVEAAGSAVAPGHNDAFNLVELTKLYDLDIYWNTATMTQMLSDLKAASIINDDDMNDITEGGRTEVKISRKEKLGFPELTLERVEEAMQLTGLVVNP